MQNDFMNVINAVENHNEYDSSSGTTYYGVTESAFKTYKSKHKDNISKKKLSNITRAEAKVVAEDYLKHITQRLDDKTNNKFSSLNEQTKYGVLLMVYNTGENSDMPNTLKAIREDRGKYDIIEAMLSGERNSSEKNLGQNKRGYLNRLYVSTKIIAGRSLKDFDTKSKVDANYNEWKTRNETDEMLNCIKRIKRDIAIVNEQSMQESNAFVANDNQEPSRNELQSVSEKKPTDTTKTQEKPYISENKAKKSIFSNVVDAFSAVMTSLGDMFNLTNKDKSSNITTGEQK